MQSETGFPSSHQLKSYVASKSRLKLAARDVLSADAGFLVLPLDAMLAQYMLLPCVRPSVRPPQAGMLPKWLKVGSCK